MTSKNKIPVVQNKISITFSHNRIEHGSRSNINPLSITKYYSPTQDLPWFPSLNPGVLQRHLKLPLVLTHWPPISHSSESAVHSSISIHVSPARSNPTSQLHSALPIVFLHAPFSQKPDTSRHSSRSISKENQYQISISSFSIHLKIFYMIVFICRKDFIFADTNH